MIMNLLVIIFYIIATIFSIKTISYGIFELKQKNFFGGTFVILFSVFSYVLFFIAMYLT